MLADFTDIRHSSTLQRKSCSSFSIRRSARLLLVGLVGLQVPPGLLRASGKDQGAVGQESHLSKFLEGLLSIFHIHLDEQAVQGEAFPKDLQPLGAVVVKAVVAEAEEERAQVLWFST